MAPLPPREQRHPFLRYQGLEYSDRDITDFEERLERIYNRGIHRVQVLDFGSMSMLMRDVLYARIRMEHRDGDRVVVFTSEAWGRVFDTKRPLFQLGGARRHLSWREFILALGLHTGEEMESPSFARDISTGGDFLGPPPSYTWIRDPVLRLCHRMMAHSIAGGLLLGGRAGLLSQVDMEVMTAKLVLLVTTASVTIVYFTILLVMLVAARLVMLVQKVTTVGVEGNAASIIKYICFTKDYKCCKILNDNRYVKDCC
ncbi:hypothetical protein Tco_0325067 [Tanacetum coccineum]